MANTRNDRNHPRAVIHKRILSAVDTHPDASTEEITAMVSAATPPLVQRVLEEYGRAMPNQQSFGSNRDGVTMDNRVLSHGDETAGNGHRRAASTEPGTQSRPYPVGLTECQQEALRLIYDHQDASQQELGEQLGISRSAVCQRLNSIEGFDWKSRLEFVDSIFGADADEQTDPERELHELVDRLSRRVDSIEGQITAANGRAAPSFGDPELVHKVIHACVTSERITEEEELRILKGLVGTMTE